MKNFTDTNGKTHSLHVDIHAARRVKAATGLPIESLLDPQSVEKWDRVALFDAIVAVAKPADVDAFAKVLENPDTTEAATQALIDEVVDFLPQRQRSLMRSLVDKTRTIQTPTIQAMQKAIDAMEVPTGSSSPTPDSPESTQPAGTLPT